MTQVVTNENMLEFIQNRQVPEFKAPESAKADPTPEKVETPAEPEKPRDESGKFVAKEEVKEAAKAADDDEDDSDLPERVRKQIGKKHRLMKEAEEFGREEFRARKAAEERAERAERALAERDAATKSRPASDSKDGLPKPEDFKTVAEYADALTDYKLEKKLEEHRKAEVAKRQQDAAAQTKSEFGERIAKVMKEIPDYEDVVSQADIDVQPHVAQYMVESDSGPHLGYHFAKHPEELARIQKLSPIRAIAELGKLETTLEKQPAPKAPATPVVSKAPAPITPLDSKGSTVVAKDPSTMTFQELRAYRMEERRAGKTR